MKTPAGFVVIWAVFIGALMSFAVSGVAGATPVELVSGVRACPPESCLRGIGLAALVGRVRHGSHLLVVRCDRRRGVASRPCGADQRGVAQTRWKNCRYCLMDVHLFD